MSWILPGTVLRVDSDSPAAAEETLSAMFLTGGLVLSQVTQITGLEPYIVQNWVRRGFVTAPKLRKYTRRQLSRILIINALKGALPIEQICQLLTYVNGTLDDDDDDTIDDTQLYNAFVVLAHTVDRDGFPMPDEIVPMIERSLPDYHEQAPGDRSRVQEVLRIMLTAWRSAQLQEDAQRMLRALPKSPSIL